MKFRRQQPFGPFVVDFYCARERLCVEIDGSVHEEPTQRREDADRQAVLESLEVRVLRIPAEMVERDIERALDLIRRSIRNQQQ